MLPTPPPENPWRIGDAAEQLGLETYVLRFWETVFPQLKPIRTPKGQRLYDASHMALLRRIQDLLHKQGMTIEGARRVLDAPSGRTGTPTKASTKRGQAALCEPSTQQGTPIAPSHTLPTLAEHETLANMARLKDTVTALETELRDIHTLLKQHANTQGRS